MDVTTATTDDIDTIVDLWVDLARDQREHGSQLLAEPNRMAIREAIVQRVVADDLLVASVDGDIVGFVMITIERGRYERDATLGSIENIFVRPAFRRRGIGSGLLTAAENALTDAGADTVGLEVMAANEGARQLYRSHGYAPHRITLQKPTENDTL